MEKFISPALLLIVHVTKADLNAAVKVCSDGKANEPHEIDEKPNPPRTSLVTSHERDLDNPKIRFGNSD